MSKSKFVDFRAVKREVSMVQVLEHYGLVSQMHRNGDSITGACPIHEGQNKTAFRVSISKNCWNCFSRCGYGGNVLDFVAKKGKGLAPKSRQSSGRVVQSQKSTHLFERKTKRNQRNQSLFK